MSNREPREVIGDFIVDRLNGFTATDEYGGTYLRPSVYRLCRNCGKSGNRGKDIDEAHTKDMRDGWTIQRQKYVARPSLLLCPDCSPQGKVMLVN